MVGELIANFPKIVRGLSLPKAFTNAEVCAFRSISRKLATTLVLGPTQTDSQPESIDPRHSTRQIPS